MSNRKVHIALGLSILLLGGALLLFLLRGQRGDRSAPAETPAPLAAAPAAVERTRAPAGAAAGKEEAEEAREEPAPPPPPPLLEGRVLGEGEGIAGASVRLFSTKRVEEAIERLEAFVPQGTAFPDIRAIVPAVLRELEELRAGGRTAVTDSTGAYRLREPPDRRHPVLAPAGGWLLRFGDVVSLSAGRTQVLALPLDRGATIAGRVVDASGAGLRGVAVAAELRPGSIGFGPLIRKLIRFVNGEFLRGP